jgi:ribosomal RNA-processing protein 9
MTKQVIKEFASGQNDDFFENLQAKAAPEEHIMEQGDDNLTKKLKLHLLEQKGKLFYSLAADFGVAEAEPKKEEGKEVKEVERSLDDQFDRVFLKGHKKAITCMNWMPDNKSIITGSKDCALIRWDLESQKKEFFRGDRWNKDFAGHFDEVICSAISANGKLMITGGKDRVVRIWDVHNRKQIKQFMGHRDTITGVTLDKENDQFYTVSADRSMKVWNLRDMLYMDSHYGHTAGILEIDAYSKNRVLSCGLDRQVVFWKVDEDAELLYGSQKHTVDTINVINHQYFLTGSYDNCIELWVLNKKKPLFTLANAHKKDSWVLSTANIRNSDLMCSGSYDGNVNFYEFRKQKRDIAKIGSVTGLPGCINVMRFAHARSADMLNKNSQLMLAVSHSQEEKLGRWHVQPKVKDGITILRKKN